MASSSPDLPVLDTVVLQAFGFGHPRGIETLLKILQVNRARFPAEVYNGDEDVLPSSEDDEDLSELARGLRYARRQVRTQPPHEGERYQSWIENASQIKEHLRGGHLEIDPLQTEELLEREELMEAYGLGRGEAACLVLARRYSVPAVFVSGDQEACEVADKIGISRITIRDALKKWVNVFYPSTSDFDSMVEGLRRAKFDPGEDLTSNLREQLH